MFVTMINTRIDELSHSNDLQYIPRNIHTVFALLCFVVVIHWLIFPYPSGLLHWHCGNLTIAPVPAKQPWWIWINTSCEFIMNDCITTTKHSTTKPCAYFLGYTVTPDFSWFEIVYSFWNCHAKNNRMPLVCVLKCMCTCNRHREGLPNMIYKNRNVPVTTLYLFTFMLNLFCFKGTAMHTQI